MATFEATVRKARHSQEAPVAEKEHCAIDPARLRTIGRELGQQVRIVRTVAQQALYTVSEGRQESPNTVVRMGAGGRRRRGSAAEFSAVVDARVPHRPDLSDAEAKRRGEFVERLTDDGTHNALIAIAPHGGQIEPYTDRQAERVAQALADRAVSAWRCKGWNDSGEAYERWHITSTDLHPASFPRLSSVISRGFRFAIALHGFSRAAILIGGAGPDTLKQDLRRAIEGALAGSGITVQIAQPADDLGGASRRNIVNRLTAGGASGIQIEQSLIARERHWRAIADAVGDVYETKLG